jgi:hypothetical protein
MSVNNIDRIWTDGNLIRGQCDLRATTMARTNFYNHTNTEPVARLTSEMRESISSWNICTNVTAHLCRRQITRGLEYLSNCLRLFLSARYVAFAPIQNASTTIRTIIAWVVRGFTIFARIPWQDELLDEFEAEYHTEQFDWRAAHHDAFSSTYYQRMDYPKNGETEL